MGCTESKPAVEEASTRDKKEKKQKKEHNHGEKNVAAVSKPPAAGVTTTTTTTTIERRPERKLPRRASQQSVLLVKRVSILNAIDLAAVCQEYTDADPTKWKCSQHQFSGTFKSEETGKKENIQGKSISKGVEHFKDNPNTYIAMMYPTVMAEWPENEQQYTYIHRAGTKGFQPKNVTKTGQVTLLLQEYERLPSFPNNLLPQQFRDKYTDQMSYQGRKLHSATNKPILPGRGMGLLDEPLLKIIGDVDPSDIKQGQVGDCWLLSGIASLAEYDGAVRRLFRKTKHMEEMPFEDGRPNMYTITLWDLKTWKEVDILIDERLCAKPDGSGHLLGAKPSEDGELWVCYLEKAIAIHCGGWDKIDGGDCTHAWALLTGCKYQYMIQRNQMGKFACYAKFNPDTQQWATLANSPHEGHQGTWQVPWPQVGGGGGQDLTLTEDELFRRLCVWDDENFLIGAASKGSSDKETTDGIVDNHAYSIIDCKNDVAGTGIDLIQVRNPWGHGEIDDGMFVGSGAGWKKYPQIRKALSPVMDDAGVFWVTKQEFFKHYETISLSASNMSAFLKPK
jgi:hypothetical protein